MMDPCESPQRQVYAPPPIAPPRGLAGFFDGYAHGQVPGEILDTSKFSAGTVYCNVYDLGDSETFRQINAFTTGNNNVLVAGLFHAGIEVYGGEWSYGFTEEDRSGVSCIHPRTHPQHTYKTTVPLGVTKLGSKEVADVCARMAREWRGNNYNLIHNNCQNYANALCQELGVARIPGWVDRIARAASAIDTTSKHVVEQAHQTKELIRGYSLQVTEHVSAFIPQDEAHVERLANEAADNFRRGSLQAFEIAEMRAKDLAEAAAAGAEVVQQTAEELGSVVQKNVSELFGEDFVKEVEQVHEETKETLRAFGRGLTQTFADLGLWGTSEQPQQRRQGELREDVRCPQGHGLRIAAAKRGECDGCGAPVQEGAKVLDCRVCNWYLCGPCSKQALTIPRAFGPSAPAVAASTSATPAAATPAAAAPAATLAAAPAHAPAPASAVDLLGDIDLPVTAALTAADPLDLLGYIQVPVQDTKATAAAASTGPKSQDLLGDDDDME